MGGKVSLKKEQDLFESVKRLDSGEDVYTARVHSKCLKCWVRIVMLRVQRREKTGMALLFSTDTDTDLDAMTILRYYKARFQIEATW